MKTHMTFSAMKYTVMFTVALLFLLALPVTPAKAQTTMYYVKAEWTYKKLRTSRKTTTATNQVNLVDGEVQNLEDAAATTVSLEGAYPNPFNPETTITFSVSETAPVRLAVYDMLGREVSLLVDWVLPAGHHTATFEAGSLATGTYLYTLATPQGTISKTVVLMK